MINTFVSKTLVTLQMHMLAEFGENDFGGILADLRRVRPVYARPKKRPFHMFGEGREFDKHLLAFACIRSIQICSHSMFWAVQNIE